MGGLMMTQDRSSAIDLEWPELTGLVRDESLALAIGVFGLDGEILYLNQGMRFLLGGEEPAKPRTAYLINPSFATLTAFPQDDEVFNGLLTIGDGLKVNQTLKARVWLRDGCLLISGEFDVLELERVNRNLSRTNQQINNLERELLKKNVLLEETIAKLHQTRKQLVEAEKMASLGVLVAGVAHEINTPAGIGLIAASSLVQRTEKLNERITGDGLEPVELARYLESTREGLGLISGNLRRIADLVSRFKQVSWAQANDCRREVALKAFLEDIVHSLGERIDPKMVKVHIICCKTLKVESYPGALTQILTNLLINSLEHGFKGGRRGEISISAEAGEGKLGLIYRDNGQGIARGDMKRLYDPFFTSDLQGHTGLGLYLLYNLVTQKFGGSVACQSEPGKGVRFEIRLPLFASPQASLREGCSA